MKNLKKISYLPLLIMLLFSFSAVALSQNPKPPYGFINERLAAYEKLSKIERKYNDPDWRQLVILRKSINEAEKGHIPKALHILRGVKDDFLLYDCAILLRMQYQYDLAEKLCINRKRNFNSCYGLLNNIVSDYKKLLGFQPSSPLYAEALPVFLDAQTALAEIFLKKKNYKKAYEKLNTVLQYSDTISGKSSEKAVKLLEKLCKETQKTEYCNTASALVEYLHNLNNEYQNKTEQKTSPSSGPPVIEPELTEKSPNKEEIINTVLDTSPLPSESETAYKSLSSYMKSKASITRKAAECLEFLKKYPLSKRVQQVEGNIIILFRSFLKKRKGFTVPSIFRRMPEDLLYKMALYAWRAGRDKTAEVLYHRLVRSYPFSNKRASSLYALARIKEDSKNYHKAAVLFKQLLEEGENHSYASVAAFKLGLMYMRTGRYLKAAEAFHRYSNILDTGIDRARSKYWIYKAYKLAKLDKEAAAVLKKVSEEIPFFFYPLIAQLQNNLNPFDTIKSRSTDEILIEYRPQNLFPWELRALRRAEYFNIIGLGRFASMELNDIEKNKFTEKFLLYLAHVYNEAGDHLSAVRILMPQILKTPEIYTASTVKEFFPMFIKDKIASTADKVRIDPILPLAVIKQESAFNKDIVSRAGAVGLMQLLPVTAENIHKKYINKNIENIDLTDPDRNLLIGMHYLKELLNRYEGNLVYALGAYNAGPSRMDEWIKKRDKDDIFTFIENIPYKETRDYVKINIRNYFWYSYLIDSKWPSLTKIENIDPTHFSPYQIRDNS